MKPERWAQITDLFSQTRNLPAAEREDLLDQVCTGDAELRQEVEALLAGDEKAEKEGFLEELPWPPPVGGPDPMIGQRIGPYQIRRFLGGGGMGSVYLADRLVPYQMQVAMKFTKPDLDTETILRLFEGEMQIHAAVSRHPNIAELLDAGSTDEGRPYFVMEYVEGHRIDDYCNDHRLTFKDRVVLFRSVLSAIEYAHHNLVIHLDLKPSNILVTQEGVAKIVDFGISRLTDLADSSRSHHLGMSRNYASPEQARGDTPITTASDIYSLGVVLTELLTGHQPAPIEKKPDREKAQASDQSLEVPRLNISITAKAAAHQRDCTVAEMHRFLSRDLGIVLATATHEAPEHRYPSAGRFSDDLLHWLEREPIEYPIRPSNLERFGLWCGRKRAAVVAGFAAVVLVAGADIWASLSRLDERIDQVHRSNVFAAQSVAATVHERMQHLGSAVAQAAQNRELERLLEANNDDRPRPTRREFQNLLERVEASYGARSGFVWSEQNPFVTWFVLDTEGTVLAHSQDAVVDANFGWRHYVKEALKADETGDEHRAEIGRIYKAFKTEEQFYKFPVFSPIRSGGQIIGVIVATVPTDSSVGTLLKNDSQLKAVLVGKGDRSRPESQDFPLSADFLIVSHPTFRRGDDAVAITHRMLDPDRRLRSESLVDDAYEDPVAERLKEMGDSTFRDYTGRWLAAFAYVENTEFVVIVQQRFDLAVAPTEMLERVMILWGGIALTILVSGCYLAYSVRQGKKGRWDALARSE